VNGPDDLIAVSGDEAIRTVLDLSQPAKDLAASEVDAAIDYQVPIRSTSPERISKPFEALKGSVGGSQERE
jgi:hypothetical protein